jgi:hypothetical protein
MIKYVSMPVAKQSSRVMIMRGIYRDRGKDIGELRKRVRIIGFLWNTQVDKYLAINIRCRVS